MDILATKQQCRCLRSKAMFVNAEPDPDFPLSGDGYSWCTHTMNCLGPDGEVADQDRCRPGRSCFEVQ